MPLLKSLLVFVLLLATYLLSEYSKPVPNDMAGKNAPDLEAVIPGQFKNWIQQGQALPDIVDVKQNSIIDRIYSQTLSRVYNDDQGKKVILSLAYGPNQTEPLRVHKPDVCYPSQGFNIETNEYRSLKTADQTLPVRFLKSVSADFTEYVTYWIVVGGVPVANDWNFKLQQLKFAVDGKIPDGLLFRVSSRGTDAKSEFELHKRFINDLQASLPKKIELFLFGKSSLSK